MDLDVLFAGTAASAPTARRGLSATLLRRGGEKLLFDCGEGTQRQLVRSVGLRRDRRGLHHPLPRRPRAGPARDAQDLRAAGARAAPAGLRPGGAAAPVRGVRAGDRQAAVRDRADRAGAGVRAPARRLPDGRVRSRARCRRTGLRADRGDAPGALRRSPRARARRGAGAGLRPPAAGRAGGRREPGPGARRPAARADRGDRRRHRAVRDDPRRVPSRRPPGARGHLHATGRRARPGHGALHRSRRGRAGGGRRGRAAGADAHLVALPRGRAQGRGAGRLRAHGRAARLRPRRDPASRNAGRPSTCAARTDRAPPRWRCVRPPLLLSTRSFNPVPRGQEGLPNDPQGRARPRRRAAHSGAHRSRDRREERRRADRDRGHPPPRRAAGRPPARPGGRAASASRCRWATWTSPSTATTSGMRDPVRAAGGARLARRLPRRGDHRRAGGRRAVHRPHRARRHRRAVRLRPPAAGAAGGAGRPRPPRASDPPRLRGQEPSDRPQRARERAAWRSWTARTRW